MVYLAIFCFILALLLLWQSNRQRNAAGLPGGRIIYMDTNHWKPAEKALYDQDIGLTGKPDYIIEHNDQIIPVEVKSSRSDKIPFDSHIYQLAAYCILIERVYDQRPPYGILHYHDGTQNGKTFAIDFTPELEEAVLAVIGEIQHSIRRKEPPRSHDSSARCKGCGFRKVCDQAMTPS